MNVLIIEDDVNKMNALSEFISHYRGIICSCQMSYNSGLNELIKNKVDLLILDMSMPTFDNSTHKAGGRSLALAGRDILLLLNHKKIIVPTVIVTQYEDFNGLSLIDLDQLLSSEVPQLYLGYVYYTTVQDGWKEKLDSILRSNGVELKEKENG